MENSILKRRLAKKASYACAALLLLGGSVSLSSCSDDLLTGTPEWLGSSIYEELMSRGTYMQTLALIDDPELTEANYHEMLLRTGSLTFFVADDFAWARFLSKRGLTHVSQLSKAEKKNLLKGSMINNAYLIELLSNKAGNPPTEGACMRRASRVDITDSVPVMTAEQMPIINPKRVDDSGEQIDYWQNVRDRSQILIYKDDNPTPMVHFLPDFMTVNDLTAEDWEVLSNGAASDVSHTSYINGQRVVEQDITCQNGYIHVLAEVPEQLPNMAEIIHSKPQFSIFSSLLDRFSYPWQKYKPEVETATDQPIYVKRYFNQGHSERSLKSYEVNGVTKTLSSVLSLDPGWNTYRLNTGNTEVNYQNDAAAMFVPTNTWMANYLQNEGAAIGRKYDYNWDNVPDEIVLPFLNNCMKNSFTSTAPSKFGSVKNTAQEEMGIEPADVDSCFMACNGVVYQLGKVFVAPEHQSILFPAMLRSDNDLSIMYRTISDTRYNQSNQTLWTLNEYQAYVNSMGSTYSFLIPKDRAFQGIVDVYSRSNSVHNPIAYRYYLDPSNNNFPVSAEALKVDTVGGKMEVTTQRATPQPTGNNASGLGLVNNRLEDLLENCLVVHGVRGSQTFRPEQTIYINKAGGPIKVRFEGDKVTGLAGSYHAEKGWWIPVVDSLVFDQSISGNGISYVLDSIPSSTITSPYAVIQDTIKHPEFHAFSQLASTACSFIGTQDQYKHTTMDNCFTILGNYHYTFYVPTNDVIEQLIAEHKLPTWEEYDEWKDVIDSLNLFKDRLDRAYVDASQYYVDHLATLTEEELEAYEALKADTTQRGAVLNTYLKKATANYNGIRSYIENFVRYHIQDGSIYIGGADTTGVYETNAVDTAMNRFHRLYIDNRQGSISVRDQKNNTANVVSGAHSNLMARQYLFDSSSRQIYGSSYVVVHLIDKALCFGDKQYLPVDAPLPATFLPQELCDEYAEGHPIYVKLKRNKR